MERAITRLNRSVSRLRGASALSIAVCFGAVVAVGCGSTAALDAGSGPGPETKEVAVSVPDFAIASNIQLVKDDGRIKVGDDYTGTLEQFPKPPKAFELTELPSNLKAPFKAKGWETATEGFGAIVYNDRIAFAMYQKEHADEDELLAIVGLQKRAMSKIAPISIVQRRVRYWIWEDGQRRSMVGALTTAKGDLNLTLAIGDAGVCSAFGIDADRLRADAAKAEELLDLPPNRSGQKDDAKQ